MSPLHPDHPSPAELFRDRLHEIRKKIGQAAQKSGRGESDICLVAVTKTQPAGRINDALAAGVVDLGESRVQEALEKRPQLRAPAGRTARHHFIGHLQTNKARKVVQYFDLIQSLDRPELAEAIDRIAGESGKAQECLVEVKISTEPTKSGVPMADAAAFLDSLGGFRGLRIRGLMAIAPMGVSEAETRERFEALNGFFVSRRASFATPAILSMGMSDDFELAIEAGSNMVRIGRALFGERT